MGDQNNIEAAKFLIARLERLSVDSYWAHRASGIRGALIRWIEKKELIGVLEINLADEFAIKALIQKGYSLLEKAAREIPDYK
jgi:hypothetical protein